MPVEFERTARQCAPSSGTLHTDGGPRFSDLSPTDEDNLGEVRVVPFSAGVMYHPHRALAFGPAVGFMRFSGERFSSFYKLVLIPMSLSVTPFAPISGKARVHGAPRASFVSSSRHPSSRRDSAGGTSTIREPGSTVAPSSSPAFAADHWETGWVN